MSVDIQIQFILADERRKKLTRAFDMIHSALVVVGEATGSPGYRTENDSDDWPEGFEQVWEQVEKAEMVLAPIRRLRLLLDIPYEWTNGLQSTEKP